MISGIHAHICDKCVTQANQILGEEKKSKNEAGFSPNFKLIKPLEIKTITALKGTTYGSLAVKSPLGNNAENYLRLLNGHYPVGEPVPGQAIKIVQ